jgi:hypothetical protein
MAHQYFHRDWQQDAKGEVWAGSETRYSWFGFLKLSWVVAVATLLLAEGLYAQTSMVIGTITYRNGSPAVNVLVSIGGRYRYRDVGGRYKLDGVPPRPPAHDY